MSFLRENYIWESLILIYEKVSYWYMRKSHIDIWDYSWMTIISWRSRKDKPVRMVWSAYYSISFFAWKTWNGINKRLWDFWIKRMSKSLSVSRIISVRSLFFWTFCEKTLRFFKIIFCRYPQLSKLSCFCCHRVFNIS